MLSQDSFEARQPPPPWLSFSVWMGVVTLGFIYVAGVLCGRESLLQSGNRQTLDFSMVLVICACLYGLGPRFNWPPVNRSWGGIVRWNGIAYVLPFFAALHWELLTRFLGAQFSLKASDLSKLEPGSVWILVLAALIFVSLLAANIVWAWQAKRLPIYCVWLLGVPCLVAWAGWQRDDGAYLHVHHYCLGIYMLPLLQFRNLISLIAQAVFLGLLVEGISRWGMDPLWYA